MKGLAICVLATAWVLEVIYLMGRWRHRRGLNDQLTREFRDVVARAQADTARGIRAWHTDHDEPVDDCNCRNEYTFDPMVTETFSNGR